MRKISFIVLGCLGLSFAFAQTDPFAEVQKTYQTATFVSADIEQQRQVTFISKPLVSTGEFSFARGHGLIWQINTPFYSRLLYRDGEIYQSTATTNSDREKASPDVMSKAMTSIIDDILSGQWRQLDEKFAVTESILLENGHQQVHLKATDRLVAKVVDRLVIDFSELIHSVEFSDVDGNVTKLMFSNQIHQQTPLTDAELAKFN